MELSGSRLKEQVKTTRGYAIYDRIEQKKNLKNTKSMIPPMRAT